MGVCSFSFTRGFDVKCGRVGVVSAPLPGIAAISHPNHFPGDKWHVCVLSRVNNAGSTLVQRLQRGLILSHFIQA